MEAYPCYGECAYKQVCACHYGTGDVIVVIEDPGNCSARPRIGVEGVTVYCLECSDDEKQDHHKE